jgi:nucleoid DNA-binding protein
MIYNKDTAARKIAQLTGMRINDSVYCIDVFQQFLAEVIENGDGFSIQGIGTLKIIDYKERDGFIPKKGKIGEGIKTHFPATKKIVFRVSDQLKELLRNSEDSGLEDE